MNDMTPPSFEPPNAEEIRRVRLGLHQLGYIPLPVATGGKPCFYSDWPARAAAGEFADPACPIDPSHMSTGILCGDVVAFDFDCEDDGVIARLEAVAAETLPAAGAVRWRENSERILAIFRAAEGTLRKRVLAGKRGQIEFLAKGQQFVAHGRHPSGVPYQWANDDEFPFPACLPPVADLPPITTAQLDAFLAAAAPILEAEPPGRKADDRAEHVPNPDKQAPIEDVVAALAVITNADLPWADWRRIGLATWAATGGSVEGREAWRTWSAKSSKHDDEKFDAAWAEITNSPPDRIGAGTLFHEAGEAAPGWWPPSRQEAREAGAAAAFAQVALPPEAAAGTVIAVPGFAPGVVPAKPPLPLRFAADIQPALDASELVQGLIPEQSAGVICGPSNVGKSFFVLDLALSIAAGRPWNGRRVEQRGVVYIALEGGVLFNNRVLAWTREHAVDPVGLPFVVIPASVDLHDPAADTDRVIAAVRTAATQMQVPVGLIVIDTLSRAMAGGDENSPAGMGFLVANTDRIRAATGSAVYHVHHLGKDAERGARGHSSLRAAIDVEIQIAAADGQHTATVTKSRDLPTGGAFGFCLRVVPVGTNKRGELISTCVVTHTGAAPRPAAKAKPLPAQAAIVLDRLRDAVAERGEALPLGGRFPAVPTRGVKQETWRGAAADALGHLSEDSRGRAFRRAVEEIANRKLTETHDGFVWLAVEPENPAFAGRGAAGS